MGIANLTFSRMYFFTGCTVINPTTSTAITDNGDEGRGKRRLVEVFAGHHGLDDGVKDAVDAQHHALQGQRRQPTSVTGVLLDRHLFSSDGLISKGGRTDLVYTQFVIYGMNTVSTELHNHRLIS